MKTSYIKTQLKNTITVSKIVTVHYYEYGKNFIYEGESHDFWEIVYIDKGQVEIRRDNESLVLSQGEIVFHKPNEFHAIKALNSSPNFFVVSFVCKSPLMKHLEKYNAVLNRTLHGFISSIIKESEETFVIQKNNHSFQKLVRKDTAPVGGEQLIRTYLEQFLIFVIRSILEKNEPTIFPSKESMENYIVRSIKNYIVENVSKKFRISDLCVQLGYSKSYISKIFREETGDTISNYHMNQAIIKAKQLIRDGAYNFSQISDELSFDTPQYFSRVFKRITGMTPTEFKMSLNLDNQN